MTAFSFNVEAAAKNEGGGDFKPEEKFIPEGDHAARMIAYIELGTHTPTFGMENGKPKPAVYDKGKRMGAIKDPFFEIQLVWATACEHSGDEPLCLLGGDFDRIKIADYMWKDPSKITNSTNIFKSIMKLREITGVDGSSFIAFMGAAVTFPVENKPNTNSKIDGMQYANTKLMKMKSTKVFADAAIALALKDRGVKVGDYIGDNSTDLPDDFVTYKFLWDTPTVEDYKSLKMWHRKRIKEALNFAGSPIHTLLDANPELYDLDKRDDEEEVPDTDTQADVNAASPDEVAPPLGGAAAALLQQVRTGQEIDPMATAKALAAEADADTQAKTQAAADHEAMVKDTAHLEALVTAAKDITPDAKQVVAQSKADKQAALQAQLDLLNIDIAKG